MTFEHIGTEGKCIERSSMNIDDRTSSASTGMINQTAFIDIAGKQEVSLV